MDTVQGTRPPMWRGWREQNPRPEVLAILYATLPAPAPMPAADPSLPSNPIPDPDAHGRRRRKTALRLAIALAILAALLWWADPGSVLQELANSDLRLLPLILALVITDRYLMAYKWALLLRARGISISNGRAFYLYLVAGFAGLFLPAGVGGDAVRLVHTSVSVRNSGGVAATIMMERLLGMLALTVVASLALAFLVVEGNKQFQLFFALAAAITIATLAALWLSTHPLAAAAIDPLLRRHRRFRISQALSDCVRDYQSLGRSKALLWKFFLWSLVERLLPVLATYTCALALGLEIHFVYFLAITPIIALLSMIPVTIGGFGLAEALFVALFALAGLSASEALALALYARATELLGLSPGAALLLRSLYIRRGGSR